MTMVKIKKPQSVWRSTISVDTGHDKPEWMENYNCDTSAFLTLHKVKVNDNQDALPSTRSS